MSISTGYGGLLACLGGSINHAPVLLTEHGIYTREREEEIISAEWVLPAFRPRWIRFFYMLSEQIYQRAWRITSLFGRARLIQIGMGAPADACQVIPNGIQYERFCDIPLKPDDGWVDIGAVVRMAPIKDVKTLIHAFHELHLALTMCVCIFSAVLTIRSMPTNAMSLWNSWVCAILSSQDV